jgi:hypothetical protein
VTWLIWRQHRTHLLFGLASLAALAAFMVPTGVGMHNEFDRRGLSECLPRLIRMEYTTSDPHRPAGITSSPQDSATAGAERCFGQVDEFFGEHQTIIVAGLLLLMLPLLAGMFWGGPLIAREVENGTHRLVWTQGVSRGRWLLVKAGLLSAGVVAITGLYAAMIAWWITPVMSTSGQRFDPIFYDQHGFVVFGYALFALALGIFAGAVTRRVLPAMATTLVGFIAMRLFVLFLLRPRFLPPETLSLAATEEGVPNRLHGDWIRGEDFFHPADRFVIFQGIETAIFIAVAVVLVLMTLYWVRQRVT